MLYGIGCDLCSLSHLEKSLSSAHAAAFVRRVYGPAEQAALGLLEGSAAPLNAHRLASRRFCRQGSLSQGGRHRPAGAFFSM